MLEVTSRLHFIEHLTSLDFNVKQLKEHTINISERWPLSPDICGDVRSHDRFENEDVSSQRCEMYRR